MTGARLSALPKISFREIREHETSQQRAFEEICYQLVPTVHSLPPGTRIDRHQAPDGGIEFSCLSPDVKGRWAWQAKFLFNLNSSAYAQMDRSAADAIDANPDLRKYIFLLPTDRTGRPNRLGISGMDQWRTHAKSWSASAAKKGMKVTFEFVGHSDLMKALVHPQHAGAVRYFFQKDFLDTKWFEHQIRREIADLGQRYRPEVNVDTEVGDVLEAVALSDTWRSALDDARDRVRLYDLKDPGLGDAVERAVEDVRAKSHSLLDRLVADWSFLCDPTRPELDMARVASDAAIASLAACEATTSNALRSLASGDESKTLRDAGYRLENEIWEVRRRVGAVGALLDADRQSNGALVLEGPAGCGKSHLLADVAQRRVARGAPTLLLLGQKFEMGDVWAQIATMAGLGLTRDELLESLSISASVAGQGRCLLMIDAINERVGVDLWPSRLAGLLADVARYPWIGVVLSIRSTYRAQILGTVSVRSVVHPGVAGHEEEALDRYGAFYGLRLADLPPLLPELENPLFLGSLCRALVTKHLDAIPRDGVGASWVFDGLISAVEQSLAKRLDFARSTHPVSDAVTGLVGAMLDHEVDELPWSDAQTICDRALPRGTQHSHSLLAGMLSEGLLLEETGPSGATVRFTYQRMGDHLMARELVHRAGTEARIRANVRRLASVKRSWRFRGLIEALSVVVPEELSRELLDVLRVAPPRARGGGPLFSTSLVDLRELTEHFVAGLPWRRPASVTARTIALSVTLGKGGLIEADAWTDVLVRLACVPNHPLNALRTDGRLISLELPERDRTWSTYTAGVYGIPTTVDRILRWALRTSASVDDMVRSLAGLLLGWFLTSPDRRVRDRATKGLVIVFDRHPKQLAALVDHFAAVNDPYVVERILAAAAGWSLRHRRDDVQDLDAWESLLTTVFDQIFSRTPPEHLMIRHYAREVVRRAEVVLREAGRAMPRDLSRCDPPYVSPWPLTAPSRQALEKAYGKDARGTVISDWDDFHRYTIAGAIKDFVPEGQKQLKAARARRLARESKRTAQALETAFSALTQEQRSSVEPLLAKPTYLTRNLDKLAPDLSRARRDYNAARWREDRRDEEVRVEPDLVARFVSQRVLDLGWTQSRFGTVDRWLGRYHDRGASTVERIAKKYAWIALYEALGRIADHSVVQPAHGSRTSDYEGPWQVGYSPDIDPSYVFHDLTETDRGRRLAPPKWWAPQSHNLTAAGMDSAWLRDPSDVPKMEQLLVHRDPRGQKWLALEAHYEWQLRSDRPKVGMTEDRRELWIRTQSYLIHASDEKRVAAWASSHNWMGINVPTPSDWHEGYFGSYPDLPPWLESFAVHFDEFKGTADGWIKTDGLAPKLQIPVAHYSLDRDRDFSNQDGASRSSILPAPSLVDLLGARWAPSAHVSQALNLGPNERERAWLYGDDVVAFYAGPRDEGRPSAMLVRADALESALSDLGFVLWTWILGEKHYWLRGQPTRQRQELYAAARLAPGGWEQWGLSIDHVDHSTGRRSRLVRERRT